MAVLSEYHSSTSWVQVRSSIRRQALTPIIPPLLTGANSHTTTDLRVGGCSATTMICTCVIYDHLCASHGALFQPGLQKALNNLQLPWKTNRFTIAIQPQV